MKFSPLDSFHSLRILLYCRYTAEVITHNEILMLYWGLFLTYWRGKGTSIVKEMECYALLNRFPYKFNRHS
jgi:hypothetical protein